MAKYRLTYFDFSGSRGEDCRLALFLSGVEFEDNRLAGPAWKDMKPSTPYGSVPTLECEGKPILAHSNVILTYVGREHGLHPKDPWEAARHEGVMASVEELRVATGPSGKIVDEAEKKKAREEFASGYLQDWGKNVSAQSRGPFVGGEAISVADVKVANMLQTFERGVLDYIPKDVLGGFPKLTALKEAFDSHPKVKEWRSRH
jgi:glutathione S-transferase